MAEETDFGANDWLIEEMLEQYKEDPDSVDETWRAYFDALDAPAPGPTLPEPQGEPAPAPAAAAKPAPAPEAEPAQPVAPSPEPGTPSDGPRAEQAAPRPTAAPKAEAQPPAEPPKRATEPAPAPRAEPKEARAPEQPSTPAKTEDKAEAAKPAEPKRTVLKGAPMRTARNMESSLTVPTATSVRSVPMKLVIETRTEINDHLKRNRGGKISFTHLIAYAQVQAIKAVPTMNNAFADEDGKAVLIENPAINLGIAIDVKKSDGSRALVVPAIKNAQDMDFRQFVDAYEALVAKGRTNSLGVDDFQGVTASITNPGGIGTNHSVPRLMGGQGHILGVGSIDYPPQFQGMSQEWLTDMAVSKITTFTSTYDHRVIQGAQSGEFLKRLHELLIGEHGFYDEIYRSLRIPYQPLRWATDSTYRHEDQVAKQARVLSLIEAYRAYGHLVADIDPLTYRMRADEDLVLEAHGLSLWDLDRLFATGDFGVDKPLQTLREILSTLRDAYCRTVGVEYMHITQARQRRWFQDRLENPFTPLPKDEQLRVLDRLNEAEIFETFLQTKFVGQKRFSLEGGESTIVVLDRICESAANAELEEVCIGMPHRGRLNVLTNIVGKSYGYVFREFNENLLIEGTGDVKYHLGAEGEFTASNGRTIKASVAANPSHLEAVNPVLEGIARAKQDALGRDDHPVLPILLHGDASFAGQGVNFETMQMSQLRGYTTGGTIHVVVNNQVGFTTHPHDSRSSAYCTDVAKAVEAPVFHVNGDDPEACARVAALAFDYRQEFHRDVVIDIVCYRRRGHNEGDDPSFTQPLMYDLVEAKRSVRKIHTENLIGRGEISAEDADAMSAKFRERLEKVFQEVRQADGDTADKDYSRVPFYPTKPTGGDSTAISKETIELIAAAQTRYPEGFEVHPKVAPQLERRRKAMLEGPVDWASAELLALGSLVLEGRPVRLSGQDSRRGTFSQRFAGVVDRKTGEAWLPLAHVADEQGTFRVYDSLLSEYAVMGFEYGYSVAMPEALVLWEAQFGDFANGAQTIADEFIAAGKAKWGQNSGVVLLLPHGYEGQGPDHSSARIERWLQLCSEGALAVCQPSTPASYFHLLRTHAYVNWHRPVVIATPKSMLRNKLAVSAVEDFTDDTWRPALDDPTITDPSAVEKVVLCSGKLRWDLVAAREKAGLQGKVAIVALERLYPLPTDHLAEILQRYGHVDELRWAQDEPENQGPWPFLALHLLDALEPKLGRRPTLRRFSRETSSAPSVGSHHVHDEQQSALVQAVLTED